MAQESTKTKISIVVAIGRDSQGRHVIGSKNELLWQIPGDLKRFKALTLGHPVIMGRKTFDSIVHVLGKPLPGRINIVVTRDTAWSYPEVVVTHSLEEALATGKRLDEEELFVIGGAELYTQALPFVDRLYLTVIDAEKEGDAFFPEYEKEFRKVLREETHDWNGISYTWIDLERA